MHKYERFIIYPLLILALFYGMAGDQVMTSATQVYNEIVAKDISILNNKGELAMRMTSDVNGSGQIRLYDNEGRQLIYLGGNDVKKNEDPGGLITVSNKYHNKVISLSETLPDENEKGPYHGIIYVFDRYGESHNSYGHSSY